MSKSFDKFKDNESAFSTKTPILIQKQLLELIKQINFFKGEKKKS